MGAKRKMWMEDRRAVIVHLAALADNDAELLRRGAATGEWVAQSARELLLDAAQEC